MYFDEFVWFLMFVCVCRSIRCFDAQVLLIYSVLDLSGRFCFSSIGDAAMSSLSRELVFLILQFLDEEKFKETVHKYDSFIGKKKFGFFFNFNFIFYVC